MQHAVEEALDATDVIGDWKLELELRPHYRTAFSLLVYLCKMEKKRRKQ
jgi:hypothetical protein